MESSKVPSRSRIKTLVELLAHCHNIMLCCPSETEYGSLNVNDMEKIKVIEYTGGVVCIDAILFAITWSPVT